MKSCDYRRSDPEHEAELVRQMIAADEAGRTDEAATLGAKLVEPHLPLVWQMAGRFGRKQRLPLEERRSIASLAALKIVRRFRPGRGAKLSSFLARSVGLMLRGATGEGTYGTQQRKKLPIRFIADLDEHLPSRPAPIPPVSASSITAALRFLDERQRVIVASYLGLEGRVESDFKRIGRELGLSGTRVRQIYDSSLHRIRGYLIREHLVELTEARYVTEGD